MMKVNRFMKVDLRASSALAYGTLVLYALVLASLLERLAAVRDARSWHPASCIYTDTGYGGRDEGDAQLLPCNSLMN